MAVTFTEFVDSRGPGTAGFSMEGGRATLLLDVTASELEDAILELLGNVRPLGNGALTRSLPKAHPQFPWLFCERISNIQGLKPDAAATTAEPALEADSLSQYQGYDRYRLTCEFTPRPYAVLQDLSIGIGTVTVYNDDDSSSGAASTTDYIVAEEWQRFVDIQADAKPELLTAQQGQMVFYTNGAVAPNGETFPGFPRINMPGGQVRVRWFQVPESYVNSRSSHLRKWVGRVNQRAFDRWSAGELLYLGYTQKRYTPPLPLRIPNTWDNFVFETEKLVDLELLFEETVRTAGTAYTTDNRSWVAGGHNLQPYLRTKKFYYAGSANASPSSSTAVTARHPTYLSFELGLLFTDPAV